MHSNFSVSKIFTKNSPQSHFPNFDNNFSVLLFLLLFTTNFLVGDKSKNSSAAVQVIKNSKIVCFDVDSTVIREEGIDELAKFCGKGQEVARLTKEAMKGSMTFQEALRLRLNIIQPTQQQIREFLKSHPSTLSPGIKEFVSRLRDANKTVYLITGGFDCLIEPVAEELGIPLDHMFANKLYFHFNGMYFMCLHSIDYFFQLFFIIAIMYCMNWSIVFADNLILCCVVNFNFRQVCWL